VFATHQRRRLGAHRREELRGHFVFQQPVSIPTECAGIESFLDHVHVEKPAEQQVVLKLLAELPLAPDRVERDQ